MHVSSAPGGRKKKTLDFEINLVPFIDLLSVCITFLLMTAVRFEVGSLDVKQAVGGQPQSETQKVPAVWTKMAPTGEVTLQLQDFPADLVKRFGEIKVPLKEGKLDAEQLKGHIAQLRTALPNLSTGLIIPTAETEYEKVIEVMDDLKSAGLSSLGVSPL